MRPTATSTCSLYRSLRNAREFARHRQDHSSPLQWGSSSHGKTHTRPRFQNIQFSFAFKGHHSHAYRFWNAGALPPSRFWPAGTTEEEWQSWCCNHPTRERSHKKPQPRDRTRKSKTTISTKTRHNYHTQNQPVKALHLTSHIATQLDIVSMCDVDSLLATEPAMPEPPPGLSAIDLCSDVQEREASAPSLAEAPFSCQPSHELSLSSATHATNQAYFQDLQQSLQIPGFVGAFMNALGVTRRESIEECDARSDSSISTSKSQTEHEVALADVFHDCILVAHRRLNRSWNDWVHIAEVVREMQALVPNWHTTLWNEWTLEEQLEACFAFADAYQSIDVVCVEGCKVRFVRQPAM